MVVLRKNPDSSTASLSRLSSRSESSRWIGSPTLSLPLYDANNSSSSMGSIGSADGNSPRKVIDRRRVPRRRASTSDDVLPLFNASNSSCGSSCGSELSPERTRSSSKERRIGRSYSGKSTVSSMAKQKKARLHFIREFGTESSFQIIILFIIFMLVLHVKSGAEFTADTLQRLRQEESLSLLQLQKIERQSLSLHENIRRRLQRDGILAANENDPLEPQHRQLEEMTSEINGQVATLQKRIQLAARKEIIKTYGEGPVKVVIELDFGGGDEETKVKEKSLGASLTEQISIALLPETPHAVWILLDQIGNGMWDGAGLEWDTLSNILQFRPSKTDTSTRLKRLEFVEHHPSDPRTNPGLHHGPWTVGLRESIPDEAAVDEENVAEAAASGNPLELFINLADNREAFRHETCIGKILDGFYALQRLLEATRMQEGKAITNVKVKSVTAMHITNHEINQLF
ncbi:hypothetical protein IV203_004216 [Nitzschia inconspicua]|uniref:PPIase cyclophilin-type domain-containing protein n=1 Tax=Nitzschia inconspicua TaxID=303405 RepID=A0A9K3L3C0_9STRA|nr:hypothetical protein IV203_004216 [Nitzschia inconspicua]